MNKFYCLFSIVFFSVTTYAADVHVFLLAGQSNMVGRDPTPFSFATDPRIMNFSDGRSGSVLNQIEVANDPLRHDKVGPTYGTNAGRPFARALLPTLPSGDKILLVNRAWGGTPIYEWNKTHGKTGYSPNSSYNLPVNPYNTAINDYLAALEAVEKTGDTPLKAGILWLQGESDVDFLTAPEMFRAASYDVLTQMRQDLGSPAMKIVIAEFYQGYGGKAGQLIRATLPLIAKDLNAGFASSDGAKVRPDGVHMLTESHEQIGIRMSNAYRTLK